MFAGLKSRPSYWRLSGVLQAWGASIWLLCSCHRQRRKVESLHDAPLQTAHSFTLSFSSTFFQHIDHFRGVFFSSQCSKNCLTFFTKPTWTDHLSRLCRRSMACNCIEWKFGTSTDFGFQRKPKNLAVVCLLNKLLFNKTAELWIFPLERRCRFLS